MLPWLLFIALGQQPAAPEFPGGEWRHADIRGLEVLQQGACVRLWLEERTYAFDPPRNGRVTGAYRNVVRAAPIGAASFAPTCKFPAPATNPVAMQTRMWSVVGTLADAKWRLRTQPGPPAGDALGLASDEFTTDVVHRDTTLVDSRGAADDDDWTLVFRRASATPTEARAALERTVTQLTSGGCLQALSSLVHASANVVDVCAARAALDRLQGRFVNLKVDFSTSFDRVPLTFPWGPSDKRRRQRGVFFEFTDEFEKVRTAGSALVYEDNGQWRVAMLWF
jgi:hypothetical protein